MQAALVIGGAGTGKTTELIRLMELTLQKQVRDPMRIGFVSFTRAARAEAAQRAGDKFGIGVDQLEKKGWFRTIHSVCHRVLGVGDELLTDRAESRKWVSEALGEEVTKNIKSIDGDLSEQFSVSTEAGRCLHIWDVARARLEPVDEVWEWHDRVAPGMVPGLDIVRSNIARYEESKARDGRCDFTDLLLRVAGRDHKVDGIDTVEPQGDLPILPVWFFDEQQDTSALSDLVCRRIVFGANWVYLVGDPFQSIYGWAGADPKFFQGWSIPADKRRILDRSFRCPRRILEQGEDILRPCTDYFDRMIQPNEEGGEIEEESFLGGWEGEIDPKDSWLILARTNRLAFKCSQLLDDAGIPWGPTESAGARAPTKAAGVGALHDLQHGGVIDGNQWQQILKLIPSKHDGKELLERGTKKRFEDDATADEFSFIRSRQLDQMGATDELRGLIDRGEWPALVPECSKMVQACDQFGADTLINPQIRVGTIHSAKGAEADNVAILTSITSPIAAARQDERGENEERRVWYVAATRARKKTLWLNDYRDRARFRP